MSVASFASAIRQRLSVQYHERSGATCRVTRLTALPGLLLAECPFGEAISLVRLLRAVRGGFDNLTDHQNPTIVNSNIDSPQFLEFSAFRRRAFTTRIRFLGRK